MKYNYKLIGPSPDIKVILRWLKINPTEIEFMVLEGTNLHQSVRGEWYFLDTFQPEETQILKKQIMDVLLGDYE